MLKNLERRCLNEYLLITFMVAMGVLCYSNTLQAPFVYDDANNIVGNSALHISELSIQDLYNAGFGSLTCPR